MLNLIQKIYNAKLLTTNILVKLMNFYFIDII